MAAHATSAGDRAFKAAFEAGDIAPAAFNHEAHLRLAYVYLVESGPELASQRTRRSLLAFLAQHEIPRAKFHETLTRAWVLAVSHFMGRADSCSFAEFAVSSQPLLDSKVMLKHYSAEALFSPAARAAFLEPDLAAIPQ